MKSAIKTLVALSALAVASLSSVSAAEAKKPSEFVSINVCANVLGGQAAGLKAFRVPSADLRKDIVALGAVACWTRLGDAGHGGYASPNGNIVFKHVTGADAADNLYGVTVNGKALDIEVLRQMDISRIEAPAKVSTGAGVVESIDSVRGVVFARVQFPDGNYESVRLSDYSYRLGQHVTVSDVGGEPVLSK